MLRYLIFVVTFSLIFNHSKARAANDAVITATKEILPAYLQFLTLPNVASESAENMRKNADWLVDTLQQHGFTASLLPEQDGMPMVYGHLDTLDPSLPTVLFYAHFDGQPVSPERWNQPSPWEPVLRVHEDNNWQDLTIETLTNSAKLNSEWRVFARSAADDKAPIMMLLAAVDALKNEGIKPLINVKVLLDSREENGSPSLKSTINSNQSLLGADAAIIMDGPMHINNQPTIVYGHRGISLVKLTTFGPESDIHSGHFGNIIYNPAELLANLIGSFKNEENKAIIPGYYDGIVIDETTRAAIDAIPIDHEFLASVLSVSDLKMVATDYYTSLLYPSLNVNWMRAAEKPKTIIPATASARIDIRTVVASPGERQIELLKTFIRSQGFHIVDGQPTAAERAAHTKLVSVDYLGGTPALQTSLDSPVGKWMRQSIQRHLNQKPIEIPIMGGTVPTIGLVEGLKIPVLLLPLVNRDNNQHAPNENLRLGNFIQGVDTLQALIRSEF